MKTYILYFLLCIVLPVRAQLATYSFAGNTGDEVFLASSDTDMNSVASPLRRGSGVLATTKANVFASRGWVSAELDTAKYVGFSITPAPNYGVEIGTFSFSIERSSTGPTAYAVKYLIDGVETQAETGILTSATQNFQLNLSIQTTSSIVFKIYAWGASSSLGTFHLRNQLNVSGISPLPVKWRYFDAQQRHDLSGVLLQWETDEEDNVHYFDIEKSDDAKDFKSIHRESPKGKNGEGASYSFLDYSPNNKTVYYRLKAVDWTKEITYSPLKAVMGRNQVIGEEIVFYPNPSKEVIILADNRFTHVRIANQKGQIVLENPLPDSIAQIDISSLPEGRYHIQFLQKSGEVIQKVFYKIQ